MDVADPMSAMERGLDSESGALDGRSDSAMERAGFGERRDDDEDVGAVDVDSMSATEMPRQRATRMFGTHDVDPMSGVLGCRQLASGTTVGDDEHVGAVDVADPMSAM